MNMIDSYIEKNKLGINVQAEKKPLQELQMNPRRAAPRRAAPVSPGAHRLPAVQARLSKSSPVKSIHKPITAGQSLFTSD